MRETIWPIIHWNKLIVARVKGIFSTFKRKNFTNFPSYQKKDISLAQLISKETGLIEAEALYWCCCGLCKGILQFRVYCLLAYIFFQIKKGGERKRDRRGFSFYEWWVAGWMGAAAVGRRWVLWKLYPPHHGRIWNEEKKNSQKIKCSLFRKWEAKKSIIGDWECLTEKIHF